ncbi:MAG: transporter [Phycisphaeraceae bacterium]|nr:transporter [Phycisphaeraceae bacterium]
MAPTWIVCSIITLAPPSARPLSADRPDVTESPYTVEPGRAQVEFSFAEWTRDDDGARTDRWSLAPMNIKIGLTERVEAQLLLAPWSWIDEHGADHADGPGPAGLRFKLNLWGNDGGDTALAVMPFVVFPVGDPAFAPERIEGGLIVPFAMELDWGFSLGLMAEFDFVWDADDRVYDLEFVHSAALGRDLFGDLGGFIEYVGVLAARRGDYQASANAGLTLGIGPDVQLDCGIGIGLTESADDLRLFAGMTVRY